MELQKIIRIKYTSSEPTIIKSPHSGREWEGYDKLYFDFNLSNNTLLIDGVVCDTSWFKYIKADGTDIFSYCMKNQEKIKDKICEEPKPKPYDDEIRLIIRKDGQLFNNVVLSIFLNELIPYLKKNQDELTSQV